MQIARLDYFRLPFRRHYELYHCKLSGKIMVVLKGSVIKEAMECD